MLLLFLIIVVVGLFTSIKIAMIPSENQRYLSLDTLLQLLVLYGTLMVGFGLIYAILELKGYTVLIEQGARVVGPFQHTLYTSLYFSAITLLSVGYGDITPVGIGRGVAIIEAVIGYIIPAAFVVRSVVEFEQKS
ncbi:two pore domain potassium channel family protein [Bacillus sp. HMF5848]|uniref:potassium channel family protein n=1 Tax=Bacillus sp. HMF5848 TaxID=2495421 RepID=UPI000F7974C4|nr:potassium channel family protein [Bacillus sp. HMF5848]RSK26161.1 two pore domain potassium channel family protein [Bacillus sp. HMF5848]